MMLEVVTHAVSIRPVSPVVVTRCEITTHWPGLREARPLLSAAACREVISEAGLSVHVVEWVMLRLCADLL